MTQQLRKALDTIAALETTPFRRTRIAVINRVTRRAAWQALHEHLAAGLLDGYDRVILQHDEKPVAHITLDVEKPYDV